MRAEFAVIGAGTIVSAIAYGLAGLGRAVIAVDSGDTDFRATHANLVILSARHEHALAHKLLSLRAI